MDESARQSHLEQLSQIFSRLTSQDVEQFYADYQRWSLYQQVAAAQQRLAALHQQMAENAAQIERVRPSAIALATLTRLQASGVEDIDLLDRMLERGEDWLDRTIQRLEYCEQQGVIRDDYEEWCRHALEDAFDWLDTLQSATSETAPLPLETAPPSLTSDGQPSLDKATKELLLQKLMSEEAEETEETTLKIATVQPANDVGAQFIAPAAGPSDAAMPAETVGAQFIAPVAGLGGDVPTDAINHAPASQETIGTQSIAPVAEMGGGEAHERDPTSTEPKKQEETAPRRPHFLRRLLLTLWR
jgi:hypothetical protein